MALEALSRKQRAHGLLEQLVRIVRRSRPNEDHGNECGKTGTA
jgi:hypothetical protein